MADTKAEVHKTLVWDDTFEKFQRLFNIFDDSQHHRLDDKTVRRTLTPGNQDGGQETGSSIIIALWIEYAISHASNMFSWMASILK